MLNLNLQDNQNIAIYNIYNALLPAVNINNALKIFQDVLQESNFEEYVVLGDFNLYYLVWNRVKIVRPIKKAEYLLEIIEIYYIEQIHMSRYVTYSKKWSQSRIYLIFITSLLWESLILCITKKYKYGSDHHRISTRFNLKIIPQPMEERRQFRKINITRLLQQFTKWKNQLPLAYSSTISKVDNHIYHLISAIQRSIKYFTPIARICKHLVLGFDSEYKEA